MFKRKYLIFMYLYVCVYDFVFKRGYARKFENMIENVLIQRQRKKLSILPKRQGSIGLSVRVFPLETGKIDGIFDGLIEC